jgi:hypothetical protein
MIKKKKNYLHRHDVGDDALPKVASTDAFVKGVVPLRNFFCSLCHTSIFFGRMQSFKFVVGPGLVHSVEV